LTISDWEVAPDRDQVGRQWTINECSSASLDGIDWEPLNAQQTFTFTQPINWITFYVNAQFCDLQVGESPVYCNDIAVEGMS